MYKVLNWWNDSLPEDDSLPCGDKLKCQSTGGITLEYDELQMILKIHPAGGFGDLVSLFKRCEQCYGPSSLKSSWLSEKYFGKGEAVIIPKTETSIRLVVFNNISKKQAFFIRTIEKDVTFVLEGKIGGLLLDGKIALHHVGDFLKSCPKVGQNQEDSSPVSLTIINSQNEEVMAKYLAVCDILESQSVTGEKANLSVEK